MSFARFLKTPFFIKHLYAPWGLLLSGLAESEPLRLMKQSVKSYFSLILLFFSYSIAPLVVVNFRYKLVDQRMVNIRRTKIDSKLFLRVELVLFDTCLIIQESS